MAEIDYLANAVEAILFVSGSPLHVSQLSAALECSEEVARSVVGCLSEKYITEKRGLRIVEANDSFQLRSSGEYFSYIKKVYEVPQKKPLTQPLLETLSIIAYRQPVTKAQIEEIRGVNADHAVNRLMELKLVTESGRAKQPGKPILFETTDEFLTYFGYKALHELPQLKQEDLEQEDIL